MHLNDELIQRTLHNELSLQDVLPVREHTAHCSACRELLDRARLDEQRVDALLQQLDHRMPTLRATAVMRSARPSPRPMRWLQYAAALLFMTTLGGVAYAAAGAPLPDFVQRMISRVRTIPRTTPSASSSAQIPAVVPAAPPRQPGAAGVAVAPGRSLLILFATAKTGGAAHVTLTDGEDVIVRAPTGAAEFTSTDGRLAIVNKAPDAVYEIVIPRNALHVEIHVGGRRLFVQDGGRITSGAVAADGRYILPLQ